VLLVNVQLATVGEPPSLEIPPPTYFAVLPLNVQQVMTGEPWSMNIPAPEL
jgi:hypothetical protein